MRSCVKSEKIISPNILVGKEIYHQRLWYWNGHCWTMLDDDNLPGSTLRFIIDLDISGIMNGWTWPWLPPGSRTPLRWWLSRPRLGKLCPLPCGIWPPLPLSWWLPRPRLECPREVPPLFPVKPEQFLIFIFLCTNQLTSVIGPFCSSASVHC